MPRPGCSRNCSCDARVASSLSTAKRRRRNQSIVFTVIALLLPVLPESVHATLFRSITGESATINSIGTLTEGGVNYTAIFKPATPPPSYVHLPWVDTTHSYSGHNSIGFEIDPTPSPVDKQTDKVQLRISHADDLSALGFGNTRYLGFAVDIPSAGFQAPSRARCNWRSGGRDRPTRRHFRSPSPVASPRGELRGDRLQRHDAGQSIVRAGGSGNRHDRAG